MVKHQKFRSMVEDGDVDNEALKPGGWLGVRGWKVLLRVVLFLGLGLSGAL
jgi:hypothetical protein